jgi:hypothetical protein
VGAATIACSQSSEPEDQLQRSFNVPIEKRSPNKEKSKVSVQQNLLQIKINDRFFWGQNLSIVFKPVSPIFLTGRNQIEYFLVSLIQIRFIIFEIAPLNIGALKGAAIPAKR